MPEIRQEMMIFVVAVITGIIVRMVYRCISCFRKIVKHSLLAMGIEDIFYWCGAAVYLFVQIYYTSDGSIRWNFILGVVVGAVLASVLLEKLEVVRKKIYILGKKNVSENIAETSEKRYDKM